jgi:hypothetical protein
VSKTLRVQATPRLYDTVCIRTWSMENVGRFMQSVICGAGTHFGNTRNLIFEDDVAPTDPDCIFSDSLAVAAKMKRFKRDFRAVGRDDKMMLILQFFAPSTQLRSIRDATFTTVTDSELSTTDFIRGGVSHRTSPGKSQITLHCSISKSHAAIGCPHMGLSHQYTQANFTQSTSTVERRIPSNSPSVS